MESVAASSSLMASAPSSEATARVGVVLMVSTAIDIKNREAPHVHRESSSKVNATSTQVLVAHRLQMSLAPSSIRPGHPSEPANGLGFGEPMSLRISRLRCWGYA